MKMSDRLLGFVLLASCPGAQADSFTFTVTNTNDSGSGSLRAAMISANGASASCDKQTVDFNISGSGVHTISLTAALPTIQIPMTIDGYSQPGSAQNTAEDGDNAVILIELDGSGAGAANGLRVGAVDSSHSCSGNTSIITGLAINRFSLAGIEMSSCATTNCFAVGGVRIQGSFIGTDATGKIARPNGVGIHFGTTSSDNFIGDELLANGGGNPTPPPFLRNVISGNTSDGIRMDSSNTSQTLFLSQNHRVRGNYIGVDSTGTKPLGNGRYGVFADIGSTGEGIHNNIISSNGADGVAISSGSYTSVLYNAIGTGVGGAALGNAGDGIHVSGGAHAITVGDTYPTISGMGFVSVAHNGGAGLYVESANATVDVVSAAFGGNGGLGVDIAPRGVNPNNATNPGVGPNQLLNAPVLLTATRDTSKSPPTTVTGELDSVPNRTISVNLYISSTCDPSGFGEGEGYTQVSASAKTDASGHATFSASGYFPSGKAITALSRDFAIGTDLPEFIGSEFSNCVVVGDDIFADGFGP